jgi:hypothetical protein
MKDKTGIFNALRVRTMDTGVFFYAMILIWIEATTVEMTF